VLVPEPALARIEVGHRPARSVAEDVERFLRHRVVTN
jgi:hypothetical protein